MPRASGEPIYYTPSNKWNSSEFASFVDQISLDDKSPYIVPPLVDKSVMFTHESFRLAWRNAASAIRRAEEIYIFGYSNPVYDHSIRFLLSQNVNEDFANKPRIIVANPSLDAYQTVKQTMPEYELDPRATSPKTIEEIVALLKATE
jgi:hypothetical protein